MKNNEAKVMKQNPTWQISRYLLERVLDGLLDESTSWEDLNAQELQVAVVDADVIHVEWDQLILQPKKQFQVL